jgi:RNA polymerase-binding transcription factor DksA
LPAGGERNPAVARKSSKKKVTKRKTSSKKKVAARSTSVARKKKTTSRKKKPAAKKKRKKTTARKTTTRKTTARKKKTSKKKVATAKKTTKRAPAKRTTRKKTEGEKTPPAKTGRDGAKRRKTQPRSPSLGAQSVAQAASAAKADAEGYVIINGRRVRMISTKGQTITRKNRTAPKPEAETREPEEASKPVKTYLTAKELRYYRDLLLVKRAELVGDLTAMEAAALEARAGNISNLPIHMADIGTDTYDQDFMLGLAQSEHQRLLEIDDALRRIADKTYGICQMTGKPIPKARLNAKPWAKYTIEAARAMEGRWGG